MKEKKKRKILAALIPVAVLFLAAVVFAQGVLKSESEAVPNPVQGISADSSLKGYLGTGFAYALEYRISLHHFLFFLGMSFKSYPLFYRLFSG